MNKSLILKSAWEETERSIGWLREIGFKYQAKSYDLL